MGGTTTWRGVTLDQRTAAMMDEVLRLCPDCPIWPSQGSYSGGVGASAGTHDGGGAIDIAGEDMSPNQRTKVETAMRQVGFAAWTRSPDQGDWPWHLHGIAVQPGGKWDQGVLSGAAHDQVVDYFEGRNGLANNAPDTGTRAHVGVTWETYQTQQPHQEDDMPIFMQTTEGHVYLVTAGREPRHLSPADWGLWQRLGGALPGSPFSPGQVDIISDMIQPS